MKRLATKVGGAPGTTTANDAEESDSRQRNSGDVKHADAVVKGDKDMTTNIHRTRNQSYGEDHPGEGNIFGRPRGPANRKGEI